MMNMDDTYIDVVIQWYSDYQGDDVNSYLGSRVKTSLHDAFYVFIALYCVLAIAGVAGCCTVLWTIVRNRHSLLNDPTHIFLACLAGYGVLMSSLVLPLTLSITLLRTWPLGSVACTVYPMLQTFPIYASLLIFLAIFVERYARACVSYMEKRRVAAVFTSWMTVIGASVIALAFTVPFAAHVTYVDLGDVLGSSFSGVALCSVDTDHEQTRKIHLISLMLVYGVCSVLPLGLSILLRAKFYKRRCRQDIDLLINKQRRASGVVYSGALRYGSHVILRTLDDCSSTRPLEHSQLQQDVLTLKYVQAMQMTYVLCWLPLTVLTVGHQLDHRLEGRVGGTLADFIHLIFFFLGFLSSITNSLIFWLWRRCLAKLRRTLRRSCVETVL